ncbi:hypothetical protein [Flavihumibacter sp. UBA7668]|uniref:hypothetical protein n=1 Tax=Flavihumibacter sp. UBA7668 TaxID=1946542 RepID=UPI0025BB9EFF|nr:hypothetical protein [Flavihumibacter sp. UBA7668]
MKMNHPKKHLFLLASTALIIGFSSCSKNKEETQMDRDPELTQATVEAEAEGELLYDDVFNNVMGADQSVAIGGTGVFQSAGSDLPGPLQPACFTITLTKTGDGFPITVTVDFGSTGCLGRDGRTRKGSFSTVYTGHMILPGSKATTSFSNYYVNGVKVEGTHTVENKSSANQWAFETRVIDGKLSRENGNQINWNRTRTFTMIDGSGTPYVPTDDTFEITSNGTGSITIGDKTGTWTSTTTQPLEKAFSCRWISAGTQEIQRVNGRKASLDFGNGECDNKATITVNGVSREITLK